MRVTPRPPFAYFGGKQNLASKIVRLLPPHHHYIEPFAGGLSVLLAKPPSRLETVNDLDHDLIHFWRVLRDRPTDLARVCALTPHSRAEYQQSAHRGEYLDDLERARRIWVKLTQGRGGQLVPTGWRYVVARDGGATLPAYLDGYVARMAAAAVRLHRVTLECLPALEVIDRYGQHPDVLLYVDPPYLGGTRGSTKAYRHEMRDETAHTTLAAALRSCRSTVFLSGYDSDLYQDLYGDWHQTRFAAFTGQGNGSPGGTGRRVEVLWSNRPVPAATRLIDNIEL